MLVYSKKFNDANLVDIRYFLECVHMNEKNSRQLRHGSLNIDGRIFLHDTRRDSFITMDGTTMIAIEGTDYEENGVINFTLLTQRLIDVAPNYSTADPVLELGDFVKKILKGTDLVEEGIVDSFCIDWEDKNVEFSVCDVTESISVSVEDYETVYIDSVLELFYTYKEKILDQEPTDMESFLSVLSHTEDLSKSNKRSTPDSFLKLAEETGEACAAYLVYSRSSGSEYKEEVPLSEVNDELTDVVITAMSIYVRLNGSLEGFDTCMQTKLNKWEKVRGISNGSNEKSGS